MKHKSVHQRLEEVAINHMAIPSLHKAQHHDRHDVSVQQVEKALKAAFLMGEREGYKHGFSDAKQACDCSLEEHVGENIIVPIVIDKETELV